MKAPNLASLLYCNFMARGEGVARCRTTDNIKKDLKDKGCEDVDWIFVL
jgi:hypothetical protein